jgi:deazaflavin-dependent oxidoreductase (nitroreductase family)
VPRKTYQRNATRRVIDGVASLVSRSGIGARMGVLSTRGRKTGAPRSTPVDLIRMDGQLHVVGIYGATAWVLNLRADPRCRVRSGRDETSYRAQELAAAEAVPVLREYLRSSSFVRDYQDVGPEDPDEALEAAAADRPVFRLEPEQGD